ncbi:MAG: hypothetical protein J6T88_04550 [Bacteroidales bacterium]|nr:hypothetical protein [Bacteroidales bacterium]
MKKTFILLSLLTLIVAARAEQLSSFAQKDNPPHIEFKYYGFYSVIDYTFMTNLNTVHGEYVDSYALNGITAVAGWQWRKESGIGIGFSYLNDAQGSFSQIPVFLEFRSHFLRNRITPFTAVQMGYSIPFGSKNAAVDYTRIDEGGITFGFSAGARFAISPKFALNLYAGYQLIQNNSVERGFNSVAATRLPELYHHFKFGLGVNF